MQASHKGLTALILILPLLIYLPTLGDFAAPYQMSESDMIGSHYPNAVFLRETLIHEGQVPLWSNTILGGYPFAANPLSGVWYPPGWLAIVLPLPLGFNLTILLHLFLGGAGMYRLLRAENYDKLPALLGAVGFELMPKLAGHYAGGHVTLLYALCWTPWLLWAENKRSRSGGVTPALILALAVLANPPGAAYAGLLWMFYSLRLAVSNFKIQPVRGVLRWGAQAGLQVLLAALLAAPLLLMFMEFAARSNRALMTLADTLAFSIPPGQLMGFWIPNFGAFPEWAIYPGALGLLGCLCVCVWPAARKRLRFWLIILLFGLFAGLGEYFPPTTWLFNLPGFSALRVPARLFFLASFASVVLMAGAAQALKSTPGGKPRMLALVLLLPGSLAGLLMTAVWAFGAAFPLEFAWGFGALALGGTLLWLRAQGRISFARFAGLALLLAALDLAGADLSQFNFRPAAQVMADGGSAPQVLAQAVTDPSAERIYSPTLSLPQQRAAALGLQLAGGVDPLHLLNYLEFFSRASGIPVEVYAVTLPPLPFQNGVEDYHAAPLDSAALGRLNVGWIVAEYALEAPGLEFFGTADGLSLYRNLNARPRAWVQADLTDQSSFQPVKELLLSANRIDAVAEGPGILVLAENSYPGWEVTLDEQPAEILTVDGLLRGVRLPQGTHNASFSYRPIGLMVGFVLQLVALIGIGVYWIRRMRYARNI